MNDNSRIAKNTVFLYIRMLAVMAISLYTSRIVLKNLGITDYGLYNVVGGIVTMFNFLNTAMTSVTQRYLSYEIGKNNAPQLNKVFNVSLVIHFFIGVIVLLLCEIGGMWFILNKMVIPDGRETAVIWAFQLSLISTLIMIISVPYNALIISKEKMNAFAFISIFEVVFKLFVAFIISITVFDRLISYAALLVFAQVFVRFLYTIYCKKNFPESKVKIYKNDPLYKEMLVFASWGLLGHMSVIVNTSVQNMMLNVFFSPIINAARGIAMQVSNAITGFNGNFQLAVQPQITQTYSAGNKDRMFSLIYNSSRFSLYLLWLLSLPVILCVDDILSIWLVEVPDYANVFVQIILIARLLSSISNPLNIAIRATGRVKYPELVGGGILLLNLPLSYVFLKMGYGPVSVFVIMIICEMATQITRVYYAYSYCGLSIPYYLKNVIIRPFFVILISAVAPLLISRVLPVEWHVLSRILVLCLVCVFSCALCVWLLGLNKKERTDVISFVKQKIKK